MSRRLGPHPLLASFVACLALSIAAHLVVASLTLSENLGHAAFHLATALPMLLLAWSIAYWCPPRRRTFVAVWGRRITIVALMMISVGLVLESIGAFGYDGDDSRIGALTTLHNGSWLIQFPGVPLLVVGLLMGLASLFQRSPQVAT